MNGSLVTHKRFIESVHTRGIDGVNFHASAEIQPLEKHDVKHPECWDASFNIRLGSAFLHIHNHDADYRLNDFEDKLKLVKQHIEEFIRLALRRAKNPGDVVVIKRTWLNPDHIETAFTGHCFYRVDLNGHGQFYLADCHKSVHFFLDIFDSDPPELRGKGAFYIRSLKSLRDIHRAIRVAIKKLGELRASIDAKQDNLKPILPK